jgi:hypothetical protein
MATVAITYRSGPGARDLRTVVCDDMRSTVVLLPTGSLDIVQAKLLHGTSCRHEFWAEVLGTDPASDDFAVEKSQVVQVREINIAVKATHKRGH